jgi:hypothetical protein
MVHNSFAQDLSKADRWLIVPDVTIGAILAAAATVGD